MGSFKTRFREMSTKHDMVRRLTQACVITNRAELKEPAFVFAMATKHTAWCHRLEARRRSNGGQLPSRNSADTEEASLANWVRKTRLRSSGPMTSESRPRAPNQQQLTAAEFHEFERAVGDLIASSSARERTSDEVVRSPEKSRLTLEQRPVMPDIVRFWQSSNRIILPGFHVFLKFVRKEFVTATADGEKYFECSTAKNIFENLDAGDLLLLVQTKSHQRVVAVGEVAHPAISREVNRAMLYGPSPHHLHDSLISYVDGAAAFDYLQFNRIYDLRDCNLKAVDLLESGGFCMDPRQTFGMGVLQALETAESTID